MSSTLEASVFMGKNYSDNLHSIKHTGENLTSKQMFDISEKFDSRTIRWDFWSVSNHLGKFSMETVVSGQWWRSHQSLACKGLCILRFCVVSWKGESEPNIQYCMGRKVELVQKFTTTQNFGHNWRRTDGIRVEYFPRIHKHCSSSAKSKSSETKWATQHNSKDELSSCRCSMTSYGELQTMNRNVLLTPHLWLCLQKDFQQDVGHSSDLDQKRSCILSVTADHKENRTESLNWWWSNSEKSDTQFSEPRVHCPEERSKAKEVENYRYTSVPMVIQLKLLFAQLILLIWGAVSDLCVEYSACQTRTVRPVLARQPDPLFEPPK